MKSVIICGAAVACVVVASVFGEQGQILISDGPSSFGQTNPKYPNIVTTDGPSKMAYQYPPPIIVSDGPSELPYQTLSGVVTTDGPSTSSKIAESSQTSASRPKIEISEGPSNPPTPNSKMMASESTQNDPDSVGKKALPDSETSTLAPMIPAGSGVTFIPSPVQLPIPSRPIPNATHENHAKAPFYIYSDKQNTGNHFSPSGWMGDLGDLVLDEMNQNQPHSGTTCIRIAYNAKGSLSKGWAGIYWLSPANNWGDRPGGYNLTGYHRLTFWARGDKGGEVISDFRVGGITGHFGDTMSAGTGSLVLSTEWRKYALDLSGQDLSHVIGGFGLSVEKNANPEGMSFYLDDIRYE